MYVRYIFKFTFEPPHIHDRQLAKVDQLSNLNVHLHSCLETTVWTVQEGSFRGQWNVPIFTRCDWNGFVLPTVKHEVTSIVDQAAVAAKDRHESVILSDVERAMACAPDSE